ncbi:hypothetical protein ACFFRR_007373 [Megaselia abdita]
MSTFCRYISFAFITFMCGSCIVVALAAPAMDIDDDDASATTMDQIEIQIETVHKNSSTASDLVSRDDNIVIVMKGDADMLISGGGGGGGRGSADEQEDDDNTNIISSSGNYGYGENLLNCTPTIVGVGHESNYGNHEGNNDAFNSSDDLIYLDTKTVHDASVTNLYTFTPSPYDEGDSFSDENDDDDGSTTYNGRIDFSDFIGLIPKEQVQGIISNYLRNDEEVRHAYSYLQSNEFSAKKAEILQLPEIVSFLKFFNQSGFEVLKLLNAVFTISSGIDVDSTTTVSLTDSPSTTITSDTMKGLTGLVDSVLDVLPQDQILSLFFDKLETSEEFSYLVKNVGSERFSKILQRMRDSAQLQYLLNALHNNGIYVARIVNILKAYFFLG